MNKLSLLAALVVFSLLGCEKDKDVFTVADAHLPVTSMSIERAKSIFTQNEDSDFTFQQIRGEESCLTFDPIWMLAEEIKTHDGVGLVTVPLHTPERIVAPGRGMQLVFYTNETCDFPVQLVLYEAKSYDASRPYPINNNSFTGFISVYDYCDCSSYIYPAAEGKLLAAEDWNLRNFEQCKGANDISRTDPKCPGFGGDSFWDDVMGFFSSIWDSIAGWFSGSTSGSGSNNGGYTGWGNIGIPGYGGLPYYGDPTGNSSGGSSTNSTADINSIFDGTFFNGEGQLVVNILEGMIADNDLAICVEVLHQELYHCLALSGIAPTGSPGHPGIGEPPPENGELSISDYISIINNLDPSNECLTEIIDQYQNIAINMLSGDGMLLCMIAENNNFDISDEGLLELIKSNCGGDANCVNEVLGCLGRLDAFQEEYGTPLHEYVIENTILAYFNNICGVSDEEFEEFVFNRLAEYYISITPNGSVAAPDAGFHDRTLSCESFVFIPQSSGDGQIACVSQLYLSKNLYGLYSYTSEFCLHVTVPKVRYTGQVISPGKAADCAAWAANAAATIVGLRFVQSDYGLSDEAMKRLFKSIFSLKMQESSCGYGVAIECEYANCLASPAEAVWNTGFFNWLDEQLFGCE